MLRVQGQNLQGVHWRVMEEVAGTLPRCNAPYMMDGEMYQQSEWKSWRKV